MRNPTWQLLLWEYSEGGALFNNKQGKCLSHSEASISNILSVNFPLSKCALLTLHYHQPNFLNFISAAQENYFITDAESKSYCSDKGTGCQIIHDSQKGAAAFIRFIYLNYTPGSKGMTACISFYSLYIFFPKSFTVVQTGLLSGFQCWKHKY